MRLGRAASSAALAAAIVAAPLAVGAQEAPPGTTPAPDVVRQPAPEPPPQPPPEPRQPPRVVSEPAPVAVQVRSAARPEAFGIGIGVGYLFPAELDRPNITSVRFRLASGLTFEPRVSISGGDQTTSIKQPGPNPDDTSDGLFVLAFGTNVRWPMAGRGPVDLVLLGSASLDYINEDPSGDDNNASLLGISVGWGLGIDWWVSQRWAVSLSAINPLFTYRNQVNDTGPGSSTTTSTTEFGAVFNPAVVLMAHLFF